MRIIICYRILRGKMQENDLWKLRRTYDEPKSDYFRFSALFLNAQ